MGNDPSEMFCHTVQDARYSIGWFVWPCDDVLIQGPGKKYPPTTMKEFMKVTVPQVSQPAFTSVCEPYSVHMQSGFLFEAS